MTAPLSGLLVLDLTHVLAGPFCTLALADLGAQVIKVETPGRGDDARGFPPFKDGKSAYFAALNHSKKSIALDLKDPSDQEVFTRLLAQADVLVENFRPGVMERLGFGWETLHKTYPNLIYAAVTGYGHSGPDMNKPAYDMVVQARGGTMSITGEKDRDPVRVGPAIGDIAAGLYLSQGILAALYDRTRTGKGRKIDVGMLDSQVAILDHAVAITTTTGKPPHRTGARHPTVTPYETFQAADTLFVIAAGNDVLFERLCLCLGLPLAHDSRFETNAVRCENARVLKRLIEAVTLEKPASHWIAKLTAAGVPTAPIQSMDEVLKDPQILARNMVVDILDRGRPAFKAAGNPVKMSGLTDSPTRPPAPALDGNRGEILRWLEDKG